MALLSVGAAQVQYDQRGAGPHLLLIHSLLTELTVFDLVLPALGAARRVTRLNLPGWRYRQWRNTPPISRG